ncbi:unnamed protein product [Zymoseptoria tritici ST99CH_3D1]|nr:unnamed protein product [Zymoseptoria tritici ST99CH_3D1]
MAQRLQELCTLLVQDAYGHTSAQIFSTLAENGRLARARLQQITRIPARQLRHALTILVQQHILLYSTSDDQAIAFYQVDWRNTYYLLRANRIITCVEERYGEGAGQIITTILQLGHVRVGDLAQAFDVGEHVGHEKENGTCDNPLNGEGSAKTNGVDSQPGHGKITSVGQFHDTLRTLLVDGFLNKFQKRSYMPSADLQTEMEEQVISEQFPDRKVTGGKKQGEFRSAVNMLKRKWREGDEFSEIRDTTRAGQGALNKRAKLNGANTNGAGHGDHGVGDSGVRLPNDMVLKVNHAQCTLALRSQRLEEMSESYLGGITSHVYGALLQVLEGRKRGRDDDIIEPDLDPGDEELRQPTATTSEVVELLDPTFDLSLSINGASSMYKITNGDSNGKPQKKPKAFDPELEELGIKQEMESDDEDDHHFPGYSSYADREKRLCLIEEHLKLLAEHSKGFCTRVGNAGHGEWRVNFPALTKTLIQNDIDATIMARFGKVHTRITRLLRERGRLDEKQVASFSMMRIKDVRVILTELQFAGLVEAQEVPKDTARTPARTIYLWIHDQERVSSILLQQTYQAMSRTFRRLAVEREAYKSAVERAEMYPDSLSPSDRDALMQWREIEEKLLMQVQRMDELVALLRDFSGMDTSLVS